MILVFRIILRGLNISEGICSSKYHRMALSTLFWNICVISTLEAASVFYNAILKVHTSFRTTLSGILLSNASWNFLPIDQSIDLTLFHTKLLSFRENISTILVFSLWNRRVIQVWWINFCFQCDDDIWWLCFISFNRPFLLPKMSWRNVSYQPGDIKITASPVKVNSDGRQIF